MGDFQFNVSKGRIRTYFDSVEAGGTARIVVVPIETSGLQDDDTLRDHATLATLLAASNNEQTTMGRKTLTSSDIELSLNNTTNKLTLTLSNSITWAAADGNAISKLVFCYDAVTGSGTDSDVIPMLAYDFVVDPSGIDIIVSAHANGLIEIS